MMNLIILIFDIFTLKVLDNYVHGVIMKRTKRKRKSKTSGTKNYDILPEDWSDDYGMVWFW